MRIFSRKKFKNVDFFAKFHINMFLEKMRNFRETIVLNSIKMYCCMLPEGVPIQYYNGRPDDCVRPNYLSMK